MKKANEEQSSHKDNLVKTVSLIRDVNTKQYQVINTLSFEIGNIQNVIRQLQWED